MTRMHTTALFMKALLAATCSSLALSTQAQEAACRLTQTITVAGQKIDIDQCLQNRGMETVQFKALCRDGSEGVPSMGIPPIKIVFLTACPTHATHSCEGFGQGKLTSYYNNNNNNHDAQRRQGCEATGGTFK